MKFFTVLLILTSVGSSSVFSQTVDPKKFNTYELEKKDKAEAVYYSGLVPGGGMFYVHKNGMGWLYLGTGALLTYLTIDQIHREQSVGLWFWSLLVIRIIEISDTFDEVDRYNEKLRASLNLSAMPGGGRLSLTIEF